MAGVRMGFAAETIDPPEIFGGIAVPSTSITGLSSRQVVFGSPSNGVGQNSSFLYDSTNNGVILADTAAVQAFPTLDALFAARAGFTLIELQSVTPTAGAAPGIFRYRSRGTFGALTSVVAGDVLAADVVLGHDGEAFFQAAAMIVDAPANWTTASHPGRLILQTAPNSTVGPVTRILVDSSGNVGVGTTAPQSLMDIAGAAPTLRLSATAGGSRVIRWDDISGARNSFFVTAQQNISEAMEFLVTSAAGSTVIPTTASIVINGPNGHVGIGGAPGGRLTVLSTGGTTNAFTVIAGTTNGVAFNVKSTGSTSKVAFWSTVGTTRPSSYTVTAVTTNRTLPSTQSTVAAAVVSTAQYVALVNAFNDLLGFIKTQTQDWAAYGLLST